MDKSFKIDKEKSDNRVCAIKIEEIHTENIREFWNEHYKYLVEEAVITDDEDKKYFQSEEYRGTIEKHMERERDKHHLAYFVENDERIGAVSYCTYVSEDGKCFVLDFWLFPQFRGKGNGHKCFASFLEHTAKDGALYYEINCDGREDRMRFWKSNGFEENGTDEYGVKLLIRR